MHFIYEWQASSSLQLQLQAGWKKWSTDYGTTLNRHSLQQSAASSQTSQTVCKILMSWKFNIQRRLPTEGGPDCGRSAPARPVERKRFNFIPSYQRTLKFFIAFNWNWKYISEQPPPWTFLEIGALFTKAFRVHRVSRNELGMSYFRHSDNAPFLPW